MRRIVAGYVAAALVAFLAALLPVQSVADITLTPAERCTRLSRQVDEAISARTEGARAPAARNLQKQGERLCAQKKRAQGIRTLAKALKLLGVKPVGID